MALAHILNTLFFLIVISNLVTAITKYSIFVEPGIHSLERVQSKIRTELADCRNSIKLFNNSSNSCATVYEVVLAEGHYQVPVGGLRFNEKDSGVASTSKVVWRGQGQRTVLDGGVNISGWKTVDNNATPFKLPAGIQLWAASAPQIILNESILQTRQLYVDNLRFNRTVTTVAEVNLSNPFECDIVSTGYRTISNMPQQWPDPATVEIVADFTWVQHRCAVTSVTNVSGHQGVETTDHSCRWGEKWPGSSPGSSLALRNASSWEDCQSQCCNFEANHEVDCKGIVFHPLNKTSVGGSCYILDRAVDGNYIPGQTGFVADMNGTLFFYLYPCTLL